MKTDPHAKVRSLRSALLLGLALALPGAPASAQETTGRPVGGRGGSPFTLDCGPEGVLVGISGRIGDQINQLVAHCRQVQNTGEWSGTLFTRGGAGPTQGAPFSLRCGQNRAVVDIQGTYGPWIHQLQINCRRLTDEGLTQGSGEDDGPIGTGGDRSFGWFTCPRSGGRSTDPFLPARGLSGTASSFIHSLVMTCGAPRVIIATSPELLSPAGGAEAQSLQPTFRWSAVPAATAYRLCVTRVDQVQNSCGVLDWRTRRTSHTPSSNLAFNNRDVLWNVQACDEDIKVGGCGPFSRPRRLSPTGRITFAELAPTFRHPRCENCHAVAAGDFTAGVGLSTNHPDVNSATNCESCHTNGLLPGRGSINPGWHAAPPGMDFRGKTDEQLCQQHALDPGSIASTPLQHLTQDELILWAVGDGRVPENGVLSTAPPNDIESWRSLVQLWVDSGMPC